MVPIGGWLPRVSTGVGQRLDPAPLAGRLRARVWRLRQMRPGGSTDDGQVPAAQRGPCFACRRALRAPTRAAAICAPSLRALARGAGWTSRDGSTHTGYHGATNIHAPSDTAGNRSSRGTAHLRACRRRRPRVCACHAGRSRRVARASRRHSYRAEAHPRRRGRYRRDGSPPCAAFPDRRRGVRGPGRRPAAPCPIARATLALEAPPRRR